MTVMTTRLLGLAGAVVAVGAVLWFAPIEWGKGRAGQHKDVIVSRDGLREGQLAGCVGDSCRIDSVSIARSQIVWIGLKVNVKSLPAPEDPTRDEVHYRDGSIHPGRLVGIDAGQVVTERGRHPRATVAWVYLTPQQKTAGNAPGQFGAPSDGGSAPNEDRGSRPNNPSSPPGDAPAAPPAPGSQRGALWTGKIESTWVATTEEGTLRRTSTYGPVRLRENIHPLLIPQAGRFVRAGTVITFVSEGTVTAERFTFTGVCSYGGRGSTALTGIQTSGGSSMWKKSVNLDTTPGIGWNVPPGPAMYLLSLAPLEAEKYAVTGCNNTSENSFSPVNIGRYPLDWMNPIPMDPQIRFLDSDGSRMSGRYTAPMAGGQITVSWSICREGVQCASPAASAPAAKAPDCPRPTSQQALLDHALAEQQRLLDKLKAQMDAYQRLADQAAQWKGDFEQAAFDCKWWSRARFLMALLIGSYAPTHLTAPTGTYPQGYLNEPGKQFSNFLYWVEKVEAGDQSWILPNNEFKGWVSLEDAWDGFKIAYDSLGPSSPEKLLAGIQSCGAPTAGVNYEGAVKYLRLMQQIEPMMRDVRRTLNDLRQKDLELLDKWNKNREACLEHAECDGQDPGHCDAPGP